MEIASAVLAALTDPLALSLLVAGVIVGLIVGVMPGVGGVFAIVLLLPLTDGLSLHAVIGMLIGLTSVTTTSDTLPAVMIGVPGSAAAIATVEDGHPMARKGQGARALGAAYFASMLGGIIGALVLALAIPVLRPLVLSLRTPDFLAVSVFGLFFVSTVSGRDPLKGIFAALLGGLVSLVGLDPFMATERMTFGQSYLWDGLSFTTVFVGLFGLVELADLLRRGSVVDLPFTARFSDVLLGIRDTVREWRLVFASSVMGTLVGAIPGIGVTTIDWIAYGIAKRDRRGGPPYGEGNVRGVIAPESANNAKEGGNLIPTLAIGLPGSIGMIFVLMVLTDHGIAPGPKMLGEQLPLLYTIVAFVVLANILGTAFCLVMTRPLAAIANAPIAYIVPIALSFIVLAAFREHVSPADLVLLMAASAVGFMMKAGGWSRAAFALGFVLGPNIERYFVLSTQLSGSAFLSRPAVVLVLIGSVVMLGLALWRRRLSWRSIVLPVRGLEDRLMIAVLALAALVGLFGLSRTEDPGRAFPLLVAGLTGLLLLPSLPTVIFAAVPSNWKAFLPLGKLMGLIALQAAAIYLVGALPALALTIILGALAIGRRPGFGILLAAAISFAVAQLLFNQLQHVTWPDPLLFRLWS